MGGAPGWPDLLRVGIGSDMHLLEPGKGVRLGGVEIPCLHSCVAVSDGDVVLHALVDAMLGTCGLGDIGDHFPASKVEPGQDSSLFVGQVLAMLTERGVNLVNVDCIVDVEVVRLSEWKRVIRDKIGGLLKLDVSRVNVKAKTAEGLGPIGEGRAVAAQVVVLVAMAGGGTSAGEGRR